MSTSVRHVAGLDWPGLAPTRDRMLAAFPEVLARNRHTDRDYAELWRRWRDGPFIPLHVVARMARSHVAGLDAPHLDAVLSYGVTAMTGGHMTTGQTYVLPIPVALGWVSEEGRPLWLATAFSPVGVSVDGETYIHRRWDYRREDLAKSAGRRLTTSAGKFKDARIPLAVHVAREMEAWCLGMEDEVRTVLAEVRNIGRKGAMGFGRVAEWRVTPAPSIGVSDILARRHVPLAALVEPVEPRRVAPRIGWTPPYWDARFHAPCRRPQRST